MACFGSFSGFLGGFGLVWFLCFVLGFLVVFGGFFQLIYSGLENFAIETSKVLLIFVFQLKCI